VAGTTWEWLLPLSSHGPCPTLRPTNIRSTKDAGWILSPSTTHLVSVTPAFTFAFYKDRRHQCLRKIPFPERHLAEPPNSAPPIIRISVLLLPSFPSLASTARSDDFHQARWLTSLLSPSLSTMSLLPVGKTNSLPRYGKAYLPT
jgi:hypothetical protein